MTTKQMHCTCTHAFQDKTYGKGNRIFNFGEKARAWICTVCSRLVQEASPAKEVKKDKKEATKTKK